MGLLEAYDAVLQRRPLPTKVLTAALMNAVSEQLARVLTSSAGGSVSASLRQSIVGISITAVVHAWHNSLERRLSHWPAAQLGTVISKTLLQMVLLEPFLAAFFVTLRQLLDGASPQQVIQSLRGSWAKLILSSWTVWGPMALLQYRFVPPNYRNLLGNSVGLFHTAYVIAVASKASSKASQALADEADDAQKDVSNGHKA
ncbi:unnamed protein product [Polarella glacialis]|uniref:Peroxisomal membrane protein MPV17 n=1 Tax=Polarella glacialis TaxID=89957 RepID=A0A813K6N6_POLGL|nr:unnamed protein product [Polarella glacialis]